MNALVLTYHLVKTTFSASFTFSAKERDPETGLSYFGSRYYSSDLSIWLSDPMSDKYPSLSPYVYCADNPVKLVDPNGEEIINPYKNLVIAACEDVENANNRLNNSQKGSAEFRAAKKQLRAAYSDLRKAENNCEKVESAINEVRQYNNDLYNSINNLMDENGLSIDVYITIDATIGSDQAGKSLINRQNGVFTFFDLDNRISTINGVKVCLNPNADSDIGLTLSHEFGHIDYIVPHATDYNQFLENNGLNVSGYDGHRPDDLSGQAARQAEDNHKKNRGY